MYRTDIWRDSEQIYGLKAQRCRECGHTSLFRIRICDRCGKSDFEEITVEREGKLFNFTVNYSVPREFNIPSIQAIADMANGVRVTGIMTDTDPEEIKIGKKVELVFRKIREIKNVPIYGFKIALKE